MLGGSIEESIFPFKIVSTSKKQYNTLQAYEWDLLGKQPLKFVNKPSASQPVPFEKSVLEIPVLPAQPLMELETTSLGLNNALQCLEGELDQFRITVKNNSDTIIDLCSIKLTDTTREVNVNDNAQDIYEHHIFYKAFASCWVHQGENAEQCPTGEQAPTVLEQPISPGESRDIIFNVLGKKYCTGIQIQLQYGSTQATLDDTKFYTREMIIPILITVTCPLAINNIDFLQATGEAYPADPEDYKSDHRVTDVATQSLSPDIAPNYFLLTFDIQNVSQEPLRLNFDIFDGFFKLI